MNRNNQTEQLKLFKWLEIGLEHQLTIEFFEDRVDEQIKQDPSELLIAPDIIILYNMLKIFPYECIHDILEHPVDWHHLHALGQLCTSFQAIAAKFFSQHLKIAPNIFEHLTVRPLCYAESFFRTFGESIESLYDKGQMIVDSNQSGVYLGYVIRYCPRVRALKCEVREISTLRSLEVLGHRLERLQLTLYGRRDYSLRGLFNGIRAADMISLELIHHSIGNLYLPTIKMAKLISLHISGDCVTINSSYYRFFRNNSQLRELNIGSRYKLADLNSLLGYVPNLNSLCIEGNADIWQSLNYTCFRKLQHLRALDLDISNGQRWYSRILKSIIAYNVPLEKVAIRDWSTENIRLPELITQIHTISHLQTIHVYSNDDLVSISMHLTNLKQLVICSGRNVLVGIVEFLVQCSDTLKQITFFLLLGYETIFDVDEDILDRIDEIAQRRNIDFKMYIAVDIYVPSSVSLFIYTNHLPICFLCLFCSVPIIRLNICSDVPQTSLSVRSARTVQRVDSFYVALLKWFWEKCSMIGSSLRLV